MDSTRGTGGNRFIPADSDRTTLLVAIHAGLVDLDRYANATDRTLDLGEVTITTKRITTGEISVTVTADLAGPGTVAPQKHEQLRVVAPRWLDEPGD